MQQRNGKEKQENYRFFITKKIVSNFLQGYPLLKIPLYKYIPIYLLIPIDFKQSYVEY